MTSRTIEFPENKTRGEKRKAFRERFPDKATVEARVNQELSSANTVAEMKTALRNILNGQGQSPGLLDALFDLDR